MRSHKVSAKKDRNRCRICDNRGTIETWGPNEGCREFMSGPEVVFCQCKHGQRERRADQRRYAESVRRDDLASYRELIADNANPNYV